MSDAGGEADEIEDKADIAARPIASVPGQNFPVRLKKFPVPPKIFPVPLHREFD
jgi:hypothetical protein